MLTVSVVIPVYNQWHLVMRNIDSLMRYDADQISEIILVDDCSPEQNPFVFDSHLITVLRNERNAGYTSTVNNGLKHAKGDIVLLLDSDAFLIEPTVERLLNRFTSLPELGCLGFLTVGSNGQRTGSYQHEPTVLGLILGQQLEVKLDKLSFRKSSPILPYSCTVCFHKSCLSGVGYFDEKNFPVLEADNDLSMRIHQSPWKLELASDIVLGHDGGNSYTVNNKRVQLFYEARWKLLRKHNRIKNKYVIKYLMFFRVCAELLILKLKQIRNIDINNTISKINGRKVLIKKVLMYD
nr:glycosyltransferase [uncultured Arsenicibacter sp.]